jgi:hypothetical protein
MADKKKLLKKGFRMTLGRTAQGAGIALVGGSIASMIANKIKKNKKPKKKMGGGMMKKPMKAAGGAAIGAIGAAVGTIGAAALRANKKIADKAKEKKNKMRQEEFRNRGKVKRKMGGGMMQRPMGYDKGGPNFMDKIVDNMGKDYDAALNKEMSKEIRNRQKVNKRDGSVETAEYDIDHNKMESNAVNKVKKKYGFDKGGMARGMGAAIKGGKFQGVF